MTYLPVVVEGVMDVAAMRAAVEGLPTTAAKIRALDAKGVAQADIARFLDRACLALAMAEGGRAMTANRDLGGLNLPVEVELIR